MSKQHSPMVCYGSQRQFAETPDEGRAFAFPVTLVHERPPFDAEDVFCDIIATPTQLAVINACLGLQLVADSSGYVRGQPFQQIDVGDMSPGGYEITPADTDNDFAWAPAGAALNRHHVTCIARVYPCTYPPDMPQSTDNGKDTMPRTYVLQDLGNLLDRIANSDLFTDAPECADSVKELRNDAKKWRELLIVEGYVK